MNPRTWLLALGCSAVVDGTAAPPQTVYRCGPDGRVYSQTPCADGQPIQAEDRRSATQRKQAKEAADRDAKQAQQLADERRQRDEAVQGQKAQGFKAPAELASAPAKKQPAKKPDAKPADPNMSPPMRVPPPAKP